MSGVYQKNTIIIISFIISGSLLLSSLFYSNCHLCNYVIFKNMMSDVHALNSPSCHFVKEKNVDIYPMTA